MKTRLAILSAVVLVGLSALPLEAQQVNVTKPRAGAVGQWRVIGQTQAGLTADHDTIVVAGPFDNFRRVKFAVTGAGLNMKHMLVVYENGEPDRIEVRQNIPEGGESRVIDLKGVGQRRIRRIDFWYDTKGVFKGHAKVTVFGMK